MLLGKIKMLNS